MPDVRLEKFSYSEFKGEPLEWSVEPLTFGQLNLLVGKNATGKSRVLNVIGCLARILANREPRLNSGNFDATFNTDSTYGRIRYILEIAGHRVVKERVLVGEDEKVLLARDNTSLVIWLEKKNDNIEYEPDDAEISAVARKDLKQHSFLIPLFEWADWVRHFHFGSQLGRDRILLSVRSPGGPSEFNEDRDEERVVAVFRKGNKEFPEVFKNRIIADMNDLGYPLTEVDAVPPEGLSVEGAPLPEDAKVFALGVREEGIPGMFHQLAMSQGMFRALSICTQINYSQLKARPTCILVDDIGEGLDFDRSTLLIKKLRQKALDSKFQLIMTTNDQFVMNNVPLDEWSVLRRTGNRVHVFNHANAKDKFEEFKFIGLSNFAFFEMDYANAEQLASEGSQGQ